VLESPRWSSSPAGIGACVGCYRGTAPLTQPHQHAADLSAPKSSTSLSASERRAGPRATLLARRDTNERDRQSTHWRTRFGVASDGPFSTHDSRSAVVSERGRRRQLWSRVTGAPTRRRLPTGQAVVGGIVRGDEVARLVKHNVSNERRTHHSHGYRSTSLQDASRSSPAPRRRLATPSLSCVRPVGLCARRFRSQLPAAARLDMPNRHGAK
jgi:hypothetical protein